MSFWHKVGAAAVAMFLINNVSIIGQLVAIPARVVSGALSGINK